LEKPAYTLVPFSKTRTVESKPLSPQAEFFRPFGPRLALPIACSMPRVLTGLRIVYGPDFIAAAYVSGY
jgi:hypothetical protein